MDGIKETVGVEYLSLGGQRFKLPRPNVDTEMAYRAYLEDEAALRIRARERTLGPLLTRAALAEWYRDCTAGTWALDADEGRRCLTNSKHLQELTWITMCQEPDQKFLQKENVQLLFKDDAARARIVRHWEDFFGVTPSIPPATVPPAPDTPSTLPNSAPNSASSTPN
jgi:hypothetical protein